MFYFSYVLVVLDIVHITFFVVVYFNVVSLNMNIFSLQIA
jgi:hypothetical protein